MNNQKNQNKYCVIVVVAAHQNIVKGHWRLLARGLNVEGHQNGVNGEILR